MLHTDNSYSSRHRHINARDETTPYALVLRDDVLENRDLVVADGMAVIIKDHKASVRCAGLMFCVEHVETKKTCGLLSERRTQRRFFHIHFVLPCHAHTDPIVSSRKQMLPFCC